MEEKELASKKPNDIKLDWWQRLHNWVGEKFIGNLTEVAQTLGNKLSYDFYQPRRFLHLEKIDEHQIIPRVSENNDRRKITTWTALVYTLPSFVLVNSIIFGVPAAVEWSSRFYRKVELDIKVATRKITSTNNTATSTRSKSNGGDSKACATELSESCWRYLANSQEEEFQAGLKAAVPNVDSRSYQLIYETAVAYAQTPVESKSQARLALNKTLIEANLSSTEISDVIIVVEGLESQGKKIASIRTKLNALNEANALAQLSKKQALTQEQLEKYNRLKEFVESN